MKTQKIGWIGLGHMGTPMAQNLIKAGFDISVYNRTAEKMKPLEAIGATPYTDVKELCENTDIIFIMLSDDIATESVFAKILNAEAVKNKFFINMSTISAELSEKLSEDIVKAQGRYLEAPVSGSVKPAQDATLIILAGGNEDDYKQATLYFEKLGKLSMLLGGVGQGTKSKLAINYYMSVVVEGLADTILFAEKNGISRETMMLIVNESACGSPMSKMKTPSILSDNYPAAFPFKHMKKDLDLAAKENLTSDLYKTVLRAYTKGMDMNLGDEDLMAVIKVLDTI